MQTDAKISFHGLDHSEAVENNIRERVAKLDDLFDRITSCRVVVETHHNSHSNMNANDRPFHVAIHLGVPGDELAVTHDKKNPKRHENIEAAIRDSFAVMERQLKEYVRKRFRDKRHVKVQVEEV